MYCISARSAVEMCCRPLANNESKIRNMTPFDQRLAEDFHAQNRKQVKSKKDKKWVLADSLDSTPRDLIALRRIQFMSPQ
jgi:hypothetical protein